MPHQRRKGHHEAPEKGRSLENQHHLEEQLEMLWTLIERGGAKVRQVYDEMGEGDGSNMLLALSENGWIRQEGEDIVFEPEGERRAREIIRRHRLAERLLYDVLDMNWENFEETACRFEHVLNHEVTESICTFLGHPRTCPHGRPIPPGPCCQRLTREVTPLVRPLSDFKVGQQGTITFITTRFRSQLHRLSSLGVIPGTTVRLRQRYPTYVIQVGETSIALDKEITKNIFARAVSGGMENPRQRDVRSAHR